MLLEGCDYNHWIIVMEFPKDNEPSVEQVVQTYEETCAKGLNISVEEAKQKIYACTTTTLHCFQVVMTEKESEKFKGLPGVIFVLPDAYIDPANKDYGGDKYINGTIIPRLRPVRYERQGRSEEEEELTLFIEEDEEEQRRNWGLSNTEWWGPSHIDQDMIFW